MSRTLKFQFQDKRSAFLAMDTLEELGYEAHMPEEGHPGELHVQVDRNDLTSALEIVQACGGSYLEEASNRPEVETVSQAYDLHTIPIPAHFVNEDWSEDDREGVEEEAEEFVNPSADTYDHFTPGIRL